MKEHWWLLIVGVLFGLLSAGLILLLSRPPRGKSVLLRPPPTNVPIVVDIDGAVNHPGIYSLPANSRVWDGVEAAGGFAANANPDRINGAAMLEDGDHLHVPFLNEENPEPDLREGDFYVQPTPVDIKFPININTADQRALEALPGVGPVTAEKIITYRQEQPFKVVEEIQNVPGIGPATFEKIQALIVVED